VPAFITAYWLGTDNTDGVIVIVGCKEIDGFDGGVDDVKCSQMGAETLSLDPIIAVL